MKYKMKYLDDNYKTAWHNSKLTSLLLHFEEECYDVYHELYSRSNDLKYKYSYFDDVDVYNLYDYCNSKLLTAHIKCLEDAEEHGATYYDNCIINAIYNWCDKELIYKTCWRLIAYIEERDGEQVKPNCKYDFH